jgi:NAD+ synthase (glutamine-hydrolysing)
MDYGFAKDAGFADNTAAFFSNPVIPRLRLPTPTNSPSRFTLVLAQLNPLVGDIDGNTTLVLDAARRACDELHADLVVFPELVLSAYPPEDLLLRPSLDLRIERALARIQDARLPACLAIGYPGRVDGKLYNMLACIQNGDVLGTYRKQCLPNYQVFDEKRYFQSGPAEAFVLDFHGLPVAFTVCEDLWEHEPMAQARAAGAKLMVNLNGSPYHVKKVRERREVMSQRVREGGMPLVYVNQVGGQDELVFDGASMVMSANGEVLLQAPQFVDALLPLDVAVQNGECHFPALPPPAALLENEAELYAALVLGLRDYVEKNRFRGVVLGLSGGVDSALTLALAVDAIGNERVEAVMMPYAYTAQMSLDDAEAEARALGVSYKVLPIGPMVESFNAALAPEFAGLPNDITEQNLQARCRGVLLMALSNKKGLLVLTTGNKSEMAVGYSTLYGDMAGGFDVLKDVPKMKVYALSHYRNTIAAVIPERVLTRAPSAELAPGQVDEDSLPPYPELDRILELYVEQDQSAEAIIREGFARATVEKVLKMVDRNEYKRRQAPVGVRISKRGFGRDRRYPITSNWTVGD